MTSTRTSRWVGAPVFVLALVVSGCVGVPQPTSAREVIVVEGLRAEYSLDKLLTESETIAVVVVSHNEDRVNNAANRVADPHRDLIHRYSSLDAVEVVRGQVPQTVRQLGGTVGNVTVHADEIQQLEEGKTYLLFLTDWLWPVGDTYEPGYGISGGPTGTFVRDGNRWVNGDGLAITMADVRSLADEHPNDPHAGSAVQPENINQ